ncbi:hypothetical protein HNQ50_003164 [Silvimonas terrae]|uniref:Uncharacterized protein n=1 Tax=Silvimonas terrae TaxID=300266 RepID=A0A840RJM6_9NEIS|nr:hypothetical protein [Silvimonas terrae]
MRAAHFVLLLVLCGSAFAWSALSDSAPSPAYRVAGNP